MERVNLHMEDLEAVTQDLHLVLKGKETALPLEHLAQEPAHLKDQ